MFTTIFDQSNKGSRWKAWSQRWLSPPSEKLGETDRPGSSRRSAEIAHRYFADGEVEYICMSCLGVVCKVRHLEDALIYQRAHTCRRQEPAFALARKVS